MKFFYINNAQCTDCGRCSESCPTGAIYISQDKKYINYDKCTACGTCMKQCTAGAVTVETLENITIELERVELYRSRINTLEHELMQAKAEGRATERLFAELVAHSPIATFVADRNNTILIANKPLTELLRVDPLKLAQMPKNLVGENIENVFSQQTIKLIRSSADDRHAQSQVVQVDGVGVIVSVLMLPDGTILGFARDLNDQTIVAQEIVARLKETIDRKMSMVQKIGFLLGEEVSVVVNNLNTVIKIIESSQEKDE